MILIIFFSFVVYCFICAECWFSISHNVLPLCLVAYFDTYTFQKYTKYWFSDKNSDKNWNSHETKRLLADDDSSFGTKSWIFALFIATFSISNFGFSVFHFRFSKFNFSEIHFIKFQKKIERSSINKIYFCATLFKILFSDSVW